MGVGQRLDLAGLTDFQKGASGLGGAGADVHS